MYIINFAVYLCTFAQCVYNMIAPVYTLILTSNGSKKVGPLKKPLSMTNMCFAILKIKIFFLKQGFLRN
jgi:hypothetical protein